jgi:hypothetical protein
MLYPMQETLLHRCLTVLPAFDASDNRFDGTHSVGDSML